MTKQKSIMVSLDKGKMPISHPGGQEGEKGCVERDKVHFKDALSVTYFFQGGLSS